MILDFGVGAAGAFKATDNRAPSATPLGASGRRPSITICGAGNGGHALAVVASQNIAGDIDWLAGSEEKARLLRQRVSDAGLRSTGAIAATAARLRSISADPAKVVPHADMVVIVVPAFAHAAVLRRITPYLSGDTVLCFVPTRGGLEFHATDICGRHNGKRPTLVGLQTLPWSTRVTSTGELVHIGAVKQQVVLSAMPASRGPHIARQLASMLGIHVIPTQSFVGMTLGNPGQFIHPGLMYGHFRLWQGQEFESEAIPLLYAQATDEMGELVAQMSDEAIAVADAIGNGSRGALNPREAVVPIHDWLRRAYGDRTGDMSTVGACFRTGPIQTRKAPMLERTPGKFTPNFGYRYLTEDVPFGLVPTRALAEIAEVATPAIDAVITWAQSAMGRTYLTDGRLNGPGVRRLPIPQNYGIATLPDLIDWYSESGAAFGAARPRASCS